MSNAKAVTDEIHTALEGLSYMVDTVEKRTAETLLELAIEWVERIPEDGE